MKILFVSRGDCCRGPMAVAVARSLLGERVKLASAGTENRTMLPIVGDVMQEFGLDLSAHSPTLLQDSMLVDHDFVVVVEARNPLGGKKLPAHVLHWPLPDPLDPPAQDAEISSRIKETRMALVQHMKDLGRQLEMRLRGL